MAWHNVALGWADRPSKKCLISNADYPVHPPSSLRLALHMQVSWLTKNTSSICSRDMYKRPSMKSGTLKRGDYLYRLACLALETQQGSFRGVVLLVKSLELISIKTAVLREDVTQFRTS